MPPNALTWENLNESVLREFPALLRDDLVEKIGGFEWSPGPYTIFGTMFSEYIRESLSRPVEEREKISSFLERMATSKVVNIEELVQIDLLPIFLEDQTTLDAYWPFLGQRTRWFIRLIAPRVAPNIAVPA